MHWLQVVCLWLSSRVHASLLQVDCETFNNMRSYFYATRHNFMKELRVTEEGPAANGTVERMERVYG